MTFIACQQPLTCGENPSGTVAIPSEWPSDRATQQALIPVQVRKDKDAQEVQVDRRDLHGTTCII